MKENIHEDASIIKDSLLKDNSDERQELEQWLEEKHLKEIYRELEKPAFLKEQFDKYSNYSGKSDFNAVSGVGVGRWYSRAGWQAQQPC